VLKTDYRPWVEIGHPLNAFAILGLLSPEPSSTLEFQMSKLCARFLKDESAATAIEYGLIAAGISIAIVAVVNGLGTNLNTKFTDINNSLK
jgi:pilus assembly protein Flp/PilA